MKLFNKKATITRIIAANPNFEKPLPEHDNYLEIAEMFANTIQGEGIYTGMPATFLRMQHCTQNCRWCDTTEVWRYGNPYTFNELFDLFEEYELIDLFRKGQHLVLTGGSPIKQQKKLIPFLAAFVQNYGFKPFIEIENECTLLPDPALSYYIDCWNNSPKLENSGNIRVLRFQPKILQYLSQKRNSWFKFVITNEKDWKEIEEDFLIPGNIRKDQIILMPQGETRKELEKNKEKVLHIAIRENVRFSTRMHVDLWDKKTGV